MAPQPDVELSALQNQFYKNLPGIKNGIFDGLMERGYFQHRPDYVRGGFVTGGIAAGIILIFIGNALAQRMGMAAAPFLVAAIVSAAIIIGFGWFMPARTPQGAKALAGVLGFEDFLTHVEADRMDRIAQTPETFEKFLPFAMALGVEKKWVGAFQNIYTQPPSWYQGGSYGGGFYPLAVCQQPGHDDGAREFGDGVRSQEQRRLGLRRWGLLGRWHGRRRRRGILDSGSHELLSAGELDDAQSNLVPLIIALIVDADLVAYRHPARRGGQHELFRGAALARIHCDDGIRHR